MTVVLPKDPWYVGQKLGDTIVLYSDGGNPQTFEGFNKALAWASTMNRDLRRDETAWTVYQIELKDAGGKSITP